MKNATPALLAALALTNIFAPTAFAGGYQFETRANCRIPVPNTANPVRYDVYMGYVNHIANTFNVTPGYPQNFIIPSGNPTSPLPSTFQANTNGYYAVKVCNVDERINLTWHVEAPCPINDTNIEISKVSKLPICANDPIPTCGVVQPPLPVELVSFSGKVSPSNPHRIELKWSTASEKNSDRFEVEVSADGIAFTKVDAVAARGNSAQTSSYVATPARDYDAGLYYARLKQIDLDGVFVYSPVVTIAITDGAKPSFSVYPNPARESVQISTLGLVGDVQGVIYDQTGREVSHFTFVAGEAVATKNLAAGIYVVRLTDSQGNVANQRLSILQ